MGHSLGVSTGVQWVLLSAGVAHFLEHMMFKGTSRIGTIDPAREALALDHLDEGMSEPAPNPVPLPRFRSCLLEII